MAKGFSVPCLQCGEEGTVSVQVHDMEEFHCSNCDADYTAADVRATVGAWQRLLDFVESAPECN